MKEQLSIIFITILTVLFLVGMIILLAIFSNINLTNNQIISQNCTLENQQYSCSPLQNECGSVSTTQQNSSEEIFTFQYYYSILVNCYTCIIGGQQCPACLPGECPDNLKCPETISFPNECVPQPSS